jgi:hypothetical protein
MSLFGRSRSLNLNLLETAAGVFGCEAWYYPKTQSLIFEGKSCGCCGDDCLTTTAPNALRGLA